MYALGVDLGTTYTAVATWRDGRVEIAALGSRAPIIPSVVCLREDGTFLAGELANRRALTEPQLVAREFKRRLGDPTPIQLGGTGYPPEELTGRLLRWVVDEASRLEGGPPAGVGVSHPAGWGTFKVDLLRRAVAIADLDSLVSFVTEPEAAATSYAQQERLPIGAMVAVYDLGGGTFDAAVLRTTRSGFEIVGKPEGIERLGGVDFDAAVFHHVAAALEGKLDELDEDDPAAVAAVARLRAECTAAKEALSSDTDTTIPVLLPNLATEVRLTRAELETMVRPALYDSIEVLRRALRSAAVSPDQLHSVLLVGGSSRMPIVAQLVGAELGRPVAVDTHPKNAVAMGAAWLAGQLFGVPGPAPPPAGPGPGPATTITPLPAGSPPTAVRGTAAVPAPPVRPGPHRPPVRRRSYRHRWQMITAAVAGAVVVLAAAGVGYAVLGPSGNQDGDPPDPPFVGELAGHAEPVWGVAYSPDGTLLASAGLDLTVRLWDLGTGQQRGEPLTGHTNEVASVAFSPDGATLASASDDGSVRRWEVTTGAPVGEPLSGHTDEVTIAVFAPDGTVIGSASDDGTVRLWDAATGQPRGEPIGGLAVRTIAFSPDGRTLAVGSLDGPIWLVDHTTGEVVAGPLAGHSGTVRSVAFSPDGATLASGGDDGGVRLWDPATGQPRGDPLTGHTGPVWGVAFGPDGTLLASAGDDRSVRLWDPATGQPRGDPLTGHDTQLRGIAISPDGRTLATAGTDGTILVHDLRGVA